MNREAKKAQNKQKIIDAALSLMTKNGFLATNVRQISQESKISYVTMYKYFGNKDELIELVIKKIIDQHTIEVLDYLQKPEMTFVKRLEALPKQIHLNERMPEPVIKEFVEILRQNKSLLDYAKVKADIILKLIIKEGRKSGLITTPASDEAIMVLLQAIYIHEQSNPKQMDKIMPDVGQIIMHGLTSDQNFTGVNWHR